MFHLWEESKNYGVNRLHYISELEVRVCVLLTQVNSSYSVHLTPVKSCQTVGI